MSAIAEWNDDDRYEQAAQAVLGVGGVVELNEYGNYRSVHVCATCGGRFTVCPPSVTFGPDCLSEACPSYDPARDAEVFFGPDEVV